MKIKDYKGFTLAEVIIVMGIIGIIAQVTIPSLIKNMQEKVTVTQLKSTYSNLSQAYTLAVQENGTPDNWSLATDGDPQGAVNILNVFAPYLKMVKNCGNGPGCLPDGPIYTSNKKTVMWADMNNSTVAAKALLPDGSWIWFYTYGGCGINAAVIPEACGALTVDVNGLKKPNALSHDIFEFYITKRGIVPTGTPNDSSLVTSFTSSCIAGVGEGCTAWVINNENMDYLNCKDLSWTGKKECN